MRQPPLMRLLAARSRAERLAGALVQALLRLQAVFGRSSWPWRRGERAVEAKAGGDSARPPQLARTVAALSLGPCGQRRKACATSGAAAQTFRARSTQELLSHGRTSARATTLSTTDERRREAHEVQRREVDDEDLSAEKRERKERPGLRLEQGEAKEICEVGATRKEDGERVREGVVTTGTRD